MSSACQWNGKACVCLHEWQSLALQWNTAGVGGVPPAAIIAQGFTVFGHLAIISSYTPMSCHVMSFYLVYACGFHYMCISAPPGTFAIHTRLSVQLEKLTCRQQGMWLP